MQTELLKKLEIQVVALSVDPLEKAEETVKGLKLTFPVGYGIDAKTFSARTGVFYEAKGLYLHAAGFLLKPGGTVFNSVYSSLALGRFGPDDVASLVEIVRSREPK